MRCALPDGAASSSAMSRSAAFAQLVDAAAEPDIAVAPPAPRTSASESAAAARTAGCESAETRCSASPRTAAREISVLARAVPLSCLRLQPAQHLRCLELIRPRLPQLRQRQRHPAPLRRRLHEGNVRARRRRLPPPASQR
eukprot:717110-Pleurochrysis_carterae.AAC.2